MVMSDTDSFLLAIRGVREEEALGRLAKVMDFSNLDPAHPLYDESRKKIPGYLKSEVPRARITEVVALKSKSYAFLTDDGGMKAVAKGVRTSVSAKLEFSAYAGCLQKMRAFEVTQFNIMSSCHLNRLVRSKKVAFSSFDDKRYQLCSLHSVPYGSSLIEKNKKEEEEEEREGKVDRYRYFCPLCRMRNLGKLV